MLTLTRALLVLIYLACVGVGLFNIMRRQEWTSADLTLIAMAVAILWNTLPYGKNRNEKPALPGPDQV